MSDDIRDTLMQIAKYNPEIFGTKEENVKQLLMIPILECFGHKNRLDFEYGTGKEIDIFIKDLPEDCKVIVETKKYDANLNEHLNQLKGYVDDEEPLLSILTNGEEIRIYSRIRGYSFRRSCLYVIRRRELNKEENINILERFLSRENLKSRRVKEFVAGREKEMVTKYQEIEKVEEDFERKKSKLESEIDELREHIEAKTAEIRRFQEEKERMIRQEYANLCFPMNMLQESIQPIQTTPSESNEEVSKVTIDQLLKKGLLKDGQKIHRWYKGKLYEASITAQGKVITLHDNRDFTSLSEAANHITGGSINGWIWWKIRDEDGNEHLINELRLQCVFRRKD